jgi:type IV pilus assembly protein PilY1
MKFSQLLKRASHFIHGLYAAILSVGIMHSAFAGEPAQYPVIISSSVKPIMMLNMSRDHQLFFKLYDDYSDITNADGGVPDGEADTTYNNNYNYYGYFDSDKCYTYDNAEGVKRFNPSSWRNKTTKSCDGTDDWGGNFLNWATMTRADAIRKILYGGQRVVDTAATSATNPGITVLERAFLPNDAHSFAKFYLPESNVVDDLKKVIPDSYAGTSGITICNTTNPSARTSPGNSAALSLSQNVTTPPLMKVVVGNYALWANNERWQCLWDNEMTSTMKSGGKGENGNVSSASGLNAAIKSPSNTNFANQNLNVRVRVCVPGYIAGTPTAAEDYKTATDNEKCKEYSSGNIKPTGLLHKFGETDMIRFGLLTGSYTKNKSGGVLRKPVSSFKDEVDLTTYDSTGGVTHTGTGVFKNPTLSIVNTLNKLRIFGYNYAEADGLYNIPPASAWNAIPSDYSYSDNCSWFGYDSSTGGVSPNSRAFFEDGRCTNWGNPQAELFLESLRYLAGLGSPSSAFNADDSAKISGLITAPSTSWSDPIAETAAGNYCAPLNILQFNSSITSYDGDQLGDAANIGISSLNAITKLVGDHEGITAGNYFIGKKSGTLESKDRNQLCTPKTISDLSAVDGLCPEAPRLEGSYHIAGLAYHARSTGLPAKTAYGREPVRTFGVALAPAVPKVSVTVGEKSFTILPACRNLSTAAGIKSNYQRLPGNCAIVDFKVVQKYTAENGGKVYVSWEDMEQGGDYDQDMWGTISYKVTNDVLEIKTDVIAQSASGELGFGYIVSGVTPYTYTDTITGATITTEGGFNVHSGINNFKTTDSGCLTACKFDDAATIRKYQLGSGAGTDTKSLNDPLYYAAKWGGYSQELEKKATEEKLNLVTAIKNRDDVSKSYYYATDPRKLEESLDEAMNNIAAAIGASATVAANSTRLDGETYVYQARFNSEDWSGDILAFRVTEKGTVDTSSDNNAKWKASSIIGRTGRTIYTYDGASTKSLVNLTSAGINAAPTLKDALKLSGESDYVKAEARFDWLMGSAASESGANLRTRKRTILGDIVNSDPAFAGPGNLRYRFLPTQYGSASFPAFAEEKRATVTGSDGKTTRIWRSLLLVGANDGMMHALDADTGSEVFAYIPRGVYSKLADLSSLNYRHQFLVDGPITIGDIYVDGDNDGVGGSWRTIAVGTLGAGGRGVYALDITDVLKSSSGTPSVIFDLTANDLKADGITSADYAKYLGFSMSRPMIVPTRDSNWKIIFANGPNSKNGTASLIAVDPENPSEIKVMDTGAKISTTSTDNGLFGAALLPDGNGVTEAAYGGDLMGNMWKFDLSSVDVTKWVVDYKNAPLVRVVDATGKAQPITSTPTLGTNPLKRITKGGVNVDATMVYFGTGKYYESTDPTDTQVQTVYAVADVESMVFSSDADRKSKLQIKEITSQSATDGVLTRTVSNDATVTEGSPMVNWATKNGWFMDLKYGTASGGERVISKPLLVFDRLIFPTFIPSTNQCDYGGVGWLMELTAVGDKYVGQNVLGVKNIPLESVILGDLIALTSGENLFIMGSGLGTKDTNPPIISKIGNNFGDTGRISWQQLK